MRFITSAILALAAITSTVVAQLNANAITKPDGTVDLQAGTDLSITWIPKDPLAPVTLKLRQGPSTGLKDVLVIGAGLPNNGAFTWFIPKDLPSGSDYAITITDDTKVEKENFTPLLVIKSDVGPKTASSSTSSGTATSDTTTATSGSSTSTTTGTHTKPHNSTTLTSPTGYPHNSTITSIGNSTSTPEPSPTETETEETSESTPTSPGSGSGSGGSSPSATGSTSGAISLLNSPLALVVCVLGAVFYLN